MLPYIVLLVFICLFITLERPQNSGLFLFILFAVLFVLVGFRSYNVGIDTIRYVNEFNLGYTVDRGTDYGYGWFVNFLHSNGVPSRLFLVLSSLLILLPIYLYVKHNSGHVSFPLLLYVTIGTFGLSLSGIRQSLAMCFALSGVVLFILGRNKSLRYFILGALIYVASTFHYSAIVCILYIPMLYFSSKNVKQTTLSTIILLVLPIVLFAFSDRLAPVVNYFIISRYKDYDLGYEGKNIVSYFVIPYVMFVYTLYLKRKVGCSGVYDNFGFLCAIGYVLCSVTSAYMPILARLSYYFSFPMLLTISNLTYKLTRSERDMFILVISIVCIVFFLISTTGGILQIDHYHFSWD